jgi:hypothetical protein
LGASVTGYEVHEGEACIAHRKQIPNFDPLNSHLIVLAFDAASIAVCPSFTVLQHRIPISTFLGDGINSSGRQLRKRCVSHNPGENKVFAKLQLVLLYNKCKENES